jgi:hypothetical protein
VAQQTAPSALPGRIQRAPLKQGGTAALHEQLIEQWRAAHGYPPHGIDPVSHQQVGPTDSEIRFGGLLDQWLAQTAAAAAPAQQRSVPAPTKAPTITPAGTTSVTGTCGMGPAAGPCLAHQSYVQNVLPQAIANIRAVTSPYSAAIADMYAVALPAARTAPAPTPMGASSNAAGGPVSVSFAGVQHTFTKVTLGLQQWAGGANGQAFSIGGPVVFINLNESSNDAILRNLPGIEETMVHEALHVLMEVTESTNRGRAAGAPMVASNLDRTSYAAERTRLVAAVRPFVDQIRLLPSFTGQAIPLTAAGDTDVTVDTFLSEAIARTEAGIYVKQRAGQGFTAADLSGLSPFFHSDAYWSPTPPTRSELVTFLATNQAAIDAAIQPIIIAVGQRYLNLRP